MSDPYFTDRIVTIYLSHKEKRGSGLVLRECSIADIGGRNFIVGKQVHVGPDAQAGDPDRAVAVDRVVSLLSVTPAHYEEQLRRTGP